MLQARFPDADERALGYAVRLQLPLVMVPTDDPWAFPSTGAFTTAASWLDAPLSPLDQSAELASRYLRAFGPASAADFQSWSGLTGARAILGRVDPPLRKYKDDQGRDLFDLVDVPIPDPDVPAPPRFLPEFDSLLLAHADRRRVVHDDHRAALVTKNLRVKAAVLLDGSVCATWSVNRRKDAATLELTPLRPLSPTTLDELGPEAMSVLEFLEPDASRYELSEVPPAREGRRKSG